jgi:hypothetical protein
VEARLGVLHLRDDPERVPRGIEGHGTERIARGAAGEEERPGLARAHHEGLAVDAIERSRDARPRDDLPEGQLGRDPLGEVARERHAPVE